MEGRKRGTGDGPEQPKMSSLSPSPTLTAMLTPTIMRVKQRKMSQILLTTTTDRACSFCGAEANAYTRECSRCHMNVCCRSCKKIHMVKVGPRTWQCKASCTMARKFLSTAGTRDSTPDDSFRRELTRYVKLRTNMETLAQRTRVMRTRTEEFAESLLSVAQSMVELRKGSRTMAFMKRSVAFYRLAKTLSDDLNRLIVDPLDSKLGAFDLYERGLETRRELKTKHDATVKELRLANLHLAPHRNKILSRITDADDLDRMLRRERREDMIEIDRITALVSSLKRRLDTETEAMESMLSTVFSQSEDMTKRIVDVVVESNARFLSDGATTFLTSNNEDMQDDVDQQQRGLPAWLIEGTRDPDDDDNDTKRHNTTSASSSPLRRQPFERSTKSLARHANDAQRNLSKALKLDVSVGLDSFDLTSSDKKTLRRFASSSASSTAPPPTPPRRSSNDTSKKALKRVVPTVRSTTNAPRSRSTTTPSFTIGDQVRVTFGKRRGERAKIVRPGKRGSGRWQLRFAGGQTVEYPAHKFVSSTSSSDARTERFDRTKAPPPLPKSPTPRRRRSVNAVLGRTPPTISRRAETTRKANKTKTKKRRGHTRRHARKLTEQV